MSNIQKYTDKLPLLSNELTKLFFLNVSHDFDRVELAITLRKDRLNVKEFGSYLNFIYRVDGHLSPAGLLSYSHYPSKQIEVSEIRIGSYDLIFEWLAKNLNNYNGVILLYLTIKFLPKVIQPYLDTIYKGYQIAELQEDILEKRYKREKKELKEQRLKKEKRAYKKELRRLFKEEFPHIEKKQREKLIETITQLYLRIGYRNIAAGRFAQKVMQDIRLSPIKNSK